VQPWRVTPDSKTGARTHAVTHGFGHALLAQVVASVFGTLKVSASISDGNLWWVIHGEPNLIPFELEHSAEVERQAHGERSFAAVRRYKKAIRAEHAGHFDLFVPVVFRGQLTATLVVGPFATAWASSADVLARWHGLTGRRGHVADPEFAAYLCATLGTLVLPGDKAAIFERLLGCLAGLIAGEGQADALANEADALRVKLEGVRFGDHMWDAVRTMVDDRSPRKWYSAWSTLGLGRFGLSRPADQVLVALATDRSPPTDLVDAAIRRHAFQRHAVALGQAMGDVITGQVGGDHGVVFLSGVRGPVERKRRKMLDLADRAAELAKKKFGLVLHFGASVASPAAPLSRSYEAALGAAESALTQGTRMLIAEPGKNRQRPSLRHLREDLGNELEEHPELLRARFDRYLEAVAMQSGYRVDAARGHLEAGFERVTQPLLASGALDPRSLSAMCVALDRASAGARAMNELSQAYRRAVSDLIEALHTPLPARHDRSLRGALDFIRQHYAEALGAPKVARVAGLSSNYFSTLFKRREGMTFADYVSGLRIERAKQLLSSTDLDVTRVARLSGFNSVHYFCLVFRKSQGLTPLGYRRKSKKKSTKSIRAKYKNDARVVS